MQSVDRWSFIPKQRLLLRMAFMLQLLMPLVVPRLAWAEDTLQTSFDLQVPVAPRPVVTDGQVRLFYELHLRNYSSRALMPLRITVSDEDSGRRLESIASAALAQRLVAVTDAKIGNDGRQPIRPGEMGVLYVELAMAQTQLPRAISHVVEYQASDSEPRSEVVSGGRIVIDAAPMPSLGPPLRGGPWAAVFAPEWERGHRRVVYTVDGRARIPGRFAIDWVKLDADGHMTDGDPDEVRNAHAYGSEVLAVADATVVSVRNDYPEVARISTNGRHRMRDASGNYVVLDIGNNRYAFYEHLRPGSVRFAPGQQVKRGEVIAQVGFSGSGNWPHLHFHVADSPSLLGAEGLPFALSSFRTLGRYEDIAALGKSPWTARIPPTGRVQEDERPADNAVLVFSAGP